MSAIIDPVTGASINSDWKLNGGVTRLAQLPAADAFYYGAVVFCHEDNRFYECQHIVTADQDYYRWVAVTQGGHRLFFIPVEKLTTEEVQNADPHPSIRTNSFDAAASALDELAFGLRRYNVKVDPLCFAPTKDTVILSGVTYYKYNNRYDRAEYVETEDTSPILNKAYFYLQDGVLVTKIFADGESFEAGVKYYESTRPMFVAVDMESGAVIDALLFNATDKTLDALVLDDLIAKYNELVDILNVTGSKLHVITDSEMNSGNGVTLFQLCKYINEMIDEVNPFSVPWNNTLQRIQYLETIVKQFGQFPEGLANLSQRVDTAEGDIVELQDQVDRTNERFDEFVINFPVVVNKGDVKYTMDFVEGAGSRMLTCKKHADQSVTHKYVFPMTIIRNGVTYYLDFDDSNPAVTEKTVFATQVTP